MGDETVEKMARALPMWWSRTFNRPLTQADREHGIRAALAAAQADRQRLPEPLRGVEKAARAIHTETEGAVPYEAAAEMAEIALRAVGERQLTPEDGRLIAEALCRYTRGASTQRDELIDHFRALSARGDGALDGNQGLDEWVGDGADAS